jgi:hypothetical protein
MSSYLAAGLVGVAVALLVFQYAARYVYNYKLSGSGITLVLFGVLPIMLVRTADIRTVEHISFGRALGVGEIFALRLGNRLWGGSILIRKSQGLVRTILITPDDSKGFMDELLGRVAQQRRNE